MINLRKEDNEENVSSDNSDSNELSGNYNAFNNRRMNRRKENPK